MSSSIFRVATLVAVVTILSKFAGFARDLVIAGVYGASMVSDAYFYAYQIPAFSLVLLGGLGGPFHTATIAVLGKRVGREKAEVSTENNKLLSSYITYTSLFAFLLTILVAVYAKTIIEFIAPSASLEMQQLASEMLLIMSPIILVGAIVGIFYGILNIYEYYFIPSIAPLVASLAIIFSVLVFHGYSDIWPLALGTLIGSAGMLVIQVPQFMKTGLKFFPSFSYKVDGFKQIGEMIFPVMVGTTIGQTNIYVDMFFVSDLPEGSWTAIVYANRLLQLPIGVLVTAMLVPIFPLFTKFVADGDNESVKKYAHTAVKSLWFLAFPILIYTLIFAQEGITVLLQRGEFDYNDTLVVSYALTFLAFSIVPYVARDTVTRIFYAYDDSKTPLVIGIFSIIVNALMDWILIKPLGVAGITLSTTIVTLFNMTLLTILIRKKLKDIRLRKIIIPTTKILVASLGMAGICYMTKMLFASDLETNKLYIIAELTAAGGIGFFVYLILCVLLRVEEAYMFVNKVKARFYKA